MSDKAVEAKKTGSASKRYWVVSGKDFFVAGFDNLSEAEKSAADRNDRGNSEHKANYGYRAVDTTTVE